MTKTLNSFLETLIFFILIAFAIILSFAGDFSTAVIDGINLWFACVLPSLFPYFIITTLLSTLKVTGKISNALSPLTKRLFNVNGSVGYALFMSIISGYPMGAKIVSDLKDGGMLTDTEATRSAALCSTSSPVFLIGSVGSLMFKNAFFGLMLFICHIISIVLVGVLFSFYKRKEKSTANFNAFTPTKLDNLLYDSVYSAVTSSLLVGGIITLFYLITEVLLSFNVLSPLTFLFESIIGDKHTAQGLVLGIIESTRGLKTLAGGGITFLSLPVCAFICGFGGISVIMQSLAYLKKAKIKTAPFLLAKLLSAVINFVIGLVFSLLFI